MKLKRIMIAAPKSGSGKTMITCALLQALKDRGQSVVSYKCGPDYIDPMFHKNVIDITSKNLDTFFTDDEETKRLFLKNRTEKEFAVLEGVMGLYDGLGGTRREGSSYQLAKVTGTPIILVVDAKGMGYSIIPMLAGFLKYDVERLIKGVILNRMSQSYYEIIKPLIEEELNIYVLGYFPEHRQFHIESRHLGLIMPGESENIKAQLQTASEELQKTVLLEQVMRIAESAGELECNASEAPNERICTEDEELVIAVARDEAFCFYYEDNLTLLQEFGARIEYFSPLHDVKLPENYGGLLIGGGYPELYAGELSENKKMLAEIKSAVDKGIPVVAECGGFMYLHSLLQDKDDNLHAMAGVVAAKCHYAGKPVRFGYVELEEKQSNFLAEGERIRGHEFHYFDSDDNGDDCIAVKPVTGKSYPCIISKENVWMGFPHLYYPSNPGFAKNFVRKARDASWQKKRS